MLSALILNLQLIARRGRLRTQARGHGGGSAPLPLALHVLSATRARIWLEASEVGLKLQLFCAEWRLPAPLRVVLTAFGQQVEVAFDAGTPTREVASGLALALDPWFDVTLPGAPLECQRAHLELRPKTRAGLVGSSTDGMVLLRCDGRGFDVEVGLDGPFASGGVVTVALGRRIARFTTAPGQHGAEVVRMLARRLRALGCLVRIREPAGGDCYRARLDLLAVDAEAGAGQEHRRQTA